MFWSIDSKGHIKAFLWGGYLQGNNHAMAVDQSIQWPAGATHGLPRAGIGLEPSGPLSLLASEELPTVPVGPGSWLCREGLGWNFRDLSSLLTGPQRPGQWAS